MHTFQASRFLLSLDRQKAAIQRLAIVSRARPSRQAICREGLGRETIQRLSATILAESVSASYIFTLHVQATRLNLKQQSFVVQIFYFLLSKNAGIVETRGLWYANTAIMALGRTS